MASISKTEFSTYRVRYRDPIGASRSKSFKRRAEADAFAATVEVSKLDTSYTDPKLGKTRFADWAEDVMATRLHLRQSTVAQNQIVLRSLVLPWFGKRRLATVKPVDVHAWIADLTRAGYAPSTIRSAFKLVALIFEAAVTSDLIGRSPCRGVRLPPARRPEMRFLDVDEIETLAAAADPRYRALVLTAAYTGLRWGEAAGLEVGGLDLLRRRLTVTQALSDVAGELTVGPPKTAAARRTITMPAFLADELGTHLGRFRSGSSDFVFTSREDTPLRRTNFRRRDWLPAVRSSVGEPCRFHDLRHSHVALLIVANEHPKVIAQRLGHASIRTTLDVYGHLFDGLDQAAADRLDALRSGSSVSDSRPIGVAEVIPLNVN